VHPPPSPGQANFTLMTECAPESRRYYSVYSVVSTAFKGMSENEYVRLHGVGGFLLDLKNVGTNTLKSQEHS
jgi:hypothetical protein